jgi:hypothetical protein
MKKDAREFAHLIKAFKGAAEFMWCNFDQIHLIAIYAECSAIEDEIQREINAGDNSVKKSSISDSNISFDDGGGFSLNKLEDVPATPEQEAKFAIFLDEVNRKAEARKKLREQKKS